MLQSPYFWSVRRLVLVVSVFLIALFLLSPTTSHAQSSYPSLGEQRVIDDGGLVSSQLARQMENTFEQVSQVHRLDLYLVTLRDTGLMDPQTYLQGLVRNWRLLGRSQAKDYMVFLLVRGEERWFVDGRGKQAQAVLPLARQDIWDQVVAARMKAGQVDDGLRLGLNAVLREVNSLDWSANKPEGALVWAEQPDLLVAAVQGGLKQSALLLFALGLWGYWVGGSWQAMTRALMGGLRAGIKRATLGQTGTQTPGRRSARIQRAWLQWPMASKRRSYLAYLLALWQELGCRDGRYEAKLYTDRQGALRFLYRPLTLSALVALPADLMVLAFVGLGLLQSWDVLTALPLYFGLPLVGLGVSLALGLGRLLACLALPLLPLWMIEALMSLQAYAQVQHLGGRRVGHRAEQTWANATLVPALGLGSLALIPDNATGAKPGVIEALAKTYSLDLKDQSLASGLRALIYGLEKHMSWSRLRRGELWDDATRLPEAARGKLAPVR